ncbi:MAG: hypothetical protein WCD79_04595 [Chthoniobacteraceae bacterium]
MKWFHLFLLCIVVIPFTACEKHPVSDLTLIGVSTEQAAEKSQSKTSSEADKSPAESGTSKQFFPDSK